MIPLFPSGISIKNECEFVTTLPAAAVKGRRQHDAYGGVAAAEHGDAGAPPLRARAAPALLRRGPAALARAPARAAGAASYVQKVTSSLLILRSHLRLYLIK